MLAVLTVIEGQDYRLVAYVEGFCEVSHGSGRVSDTGSTFKYHKRRSRLCIAQEAGAAVVLSKVVLEDHLMRRKSPRLNRSWACKWTVHQKVPQIQDTLATTTLLVDITHAHSQILRFVDRCKRGGTFVPIMN